MLDPWPIKTFAYTNKNSLLVLLTAQEPKLGAAVLLAMLTLGLSSTLGEEMVRLLPSGMWDIGRQKVRIYNS